LNCQSRTNSSDRDLSDHRKRSQLEMTEFYFIDRTQNQKTRCDGVMPSSLGPWLGSYVKCRDDPGTL